MSSVPRPSRVLLLAEPGYPVGDLESRLLASGLAPEIRHIQTIAEMSSALLAHDWDVLVAHAAPGINAMGALTLLTRTGFLVPFVVLPAGTQVSAVLEALGVGSDGAPAELPPEEPVRTSYSPTADQGPLPPPAQALQPMNPVEILGGMEDMLRRMAGPEIDLAILFGHGVRTVQAGPGQIEQVVLNLVLNALEAMPRGGRLLVELENSRPDEVEDPAPGGPGEGEFVILSISDTGVGMGPATQREIFAPFFTMKDPEGAAGLGLSAVHAVVRRFGGHIAVDSAPGQGTTFRVFFPVPAASPLTIPR